MNDTCVVINRKDSKEKVKTKTTTLFDDDLASELFQNEIKESSLTNNSSPKKIHQNYSKDYVKAKSPTIFDDDVPSTNQKDSKATVKTRASKLLDKDTPLGLLGMVLKWSAPSLSEFQNEIKESSVKNVSPRTIHQNCSKDNVKTKAFSLFDDDLPSTNQNDSKAIKIKQTSLSDDDVPLNLFRMALKWTAPSLSEFQNEIKVPSIRNDSSVATNPQNLKAIKTKLPSLFDDDVPAVFVDDPARLAMPAKSEEQDAANMVINFPNFNGVVKSESSYIDNPAADYKLMYMESLSMYAEEREKRLELERHVAALECQVSQLKAQVQRLQGPDSRRSRDSTADDSEDSFDDAAADDTCDTARAAPSEVARRQEGRTRQQGADLVM